jgi:hypothetical protein
MRPWLDCYPGVDVTAVTGKPTFVPQSRRVRPAYPRLLLAVMDAVLSMMIR